LFKIRDAVDSTEGLSEILEPPPCCVRFGIDLSIFSILRPGFSNCCFDEADDTAPFATCCCCCCEEEEVVVVADDFCFGSALVAVVVVLLEACGRFVAPCGFVALLDVLALFPAVF
jgi:hypothetical protein